MRHEKILADVISRAVRFKIDAELSNGSASGSGMKAGSVVYGLAAFAAASAFSKVVGGRTKPESTRIASTPDVVDVDRSAKSSSGRVAGIRALVKDAEVAEGYGDHRFDGDADRYQARLEELRESIATLSLERNTLEERANESESRCADLAKKVLLATTELERLESRKLALIGEAEQLKAQIEADHAAKEEVVDEDLSDFDVEDLKRQVAELSHEFRRKESGVKYAAATLSTLTNDKRAIEVNYQSICSQLSSAKAIGDTAAEIEPLEESKQSLAKQLEKVNDELSKYSALSETEKEDLDRLFREREQKTQLLSDIESGEVKTDSVAVEEVDSQEVLELKQRLFEVEELLRVSEAQADEVAEITAGLEKKLGAAEEEILELQVKLDASICREEELQNEVERLKAGLVEYRENESKLEEKREKDRIEVEKLRQRVESLEQQKKSLTDELSVYQTGASDLEQKYGDAKQQLSDSNARERKLAVDIADLQSAIKNLETEKVDLQSDKNQLAETKALMSVATDERSKAERELESASQKIEELELSIQERVAAEAAYENSRSEMESDLKARESQAREASRDLEEVKGREVALARHVGSLEQTIENLNEEVDRWKLLKEQLDEADTTSNSLLDAQKRLGDQLATAKAGEDSAQKKVKELEALSDTVEKQNSDLRSRLDKLSHECQELREFRANAEEEKNQVSGEVSRLTGNLSDQQTREKKLGEKVSVLESELERRGERVIELEESEKRLLAELEEMESELEKAVTSRKHTEEGLAQLQNSYSKVTTDRDVYCEKAAELELTLAELKEAASERENQLDNRVVELEHEIDIRDKQLKNLLDDTRPNELTEVQPLTVPSSKKRFTKNFDVIPQPVSDQLGEKPTEEVRKEEPVKEAPKVDSTEELKAISPLTEDTDVFSVGLGDEKDDVSEKKAEIPFVAKKMVGAVPPAIPDSGSGDEKSYSPDRSFDSLVADSKRRKEEQVSLNPEDQWKKEERPAKQDGSGAKWLALIGGGAVVGLGATAALLYLEMQEENKIAEASGGSSQASAGNPIGAGPALNPIANPENPLFGDEALSRTKESLNTFFGASSVEEKAEVARQPKRTARHMEIYYAKEPFEDLKVESVDLIPKEEDLGGGSIGVKAVVKFEGRSKPVSLFMERADDGRMLLDWETLFRFQRIPWEQYLNIRPQEAIDMHVSVGNGADEHPDISPEDYFGVRVQGWDTDAIRWTTAYIKRDAPGAQAFIDKITKMSKATDSYGSPSARAYYILKLRHTGDDSDPTRPLYIEEIVADGFRYPSDAKAGEVEISGDVSYDDSSY